MAKYMFLIGVTLWLASLAVCEEKKELLVITVATEATDGYKRYMRSARVYGVSVKVLGMGHDWQGGEMAVGVGGGQKINLLREELAKHKDRKDLIIVFTDSYDVIFTSGPAELLQKFSKCKCRVLFGAEDTCWPDKSLAPRYPKVSYGYRYLNSGGFMGYAAELYSLVARDGPVEPDSDDQLYYTLVYIDEASRNKLNIKIDSQSKIFQNLNNNAADVQLKFTPEDTRLVNTVYQTKPVVIHGNGPSKVLLTSLGNYLAKSWTMEDGCLSCAENTKDLSQVEDTKLPLVMVAVFIELGTPFLKEMLQKIAAINYPKSRIHIFIHSQVPHHSPLLEEFMSSHDGYASMKLVGPDDKVKEWHARNRAVSECLEVECDALFSVDSEVHVDNPQTLRILLQHNRPILAAIMVQPGRAWSTFWGAVTADGYYARSTDYMDIVNSIRRGVWAVPYITGVYLLQKSMLADPRTRPDFINNLLDADMAMASNYRNKDILMYAVNMGDYGHLIDSSTFMTEKLHPDLWQMVSNKEDWEKRYLHAEYYHALNISTLNELPCPDVYWFPLFSETYCNELIATMEDFNGWSGAASTDARVPGGYENVPTDDVHMTQVGFQDESNYIIKEYVRPLAEKVYLGYNGNGHADLIFVVRYNPKYQKLLRPHHDSSTYTINVGLNRPGIDYEGGGARFIRYNCSVVNTRMGWALLHPGRLTHYHEGLQTTSGTRYILVAFIDP